MVLIGKSNQVGTRIYDDGEKVRNVRKRILVGPNENAPVFSMRKFTVETAGHTPYHTHA